MRKSILFIISVLLILITTSFNTSTPKNICFRIELNKEVYTESLWGDAPQFALWLVNRNDKKLINVYVTHRTAENDWIGKASCSVSLPIWSLYNVKYDLVERETVNGAVTIDAISGATIKIKDILKWTLTNNKKYLSGIDGVSCATPKNNIKGYLEATTDKILEIYFEINCSGDYNEFYKSKNLETGEIDYYGNGQPSLVYKGKINMQNFRIEQPKLYGKSHQHFPIDKINISTDSITTAKRLVKNILIEIK